MVALAERSALHEYGCLFCRRHDGGFTSQEHIFSQALGNLDKYVLPRGVVCDRCNNGKLAEADEALIGFQPITLLRAERGLPTKARKPVISRWGNATVVWPERGTIAVYGSPKAVRRPRADDAGALGSLKLTTGGPLTAKRISLMVRSIWKSALEFIYIDHGVRIAYDSVFDAVREAIIEPGLPHGWAVVPRDAKAGSSVTLSYQLLTPQELLAVPIRLDVFGVVFYTDLLLRDVREEDLTTPGPANIWIF